MPATSRLDKGSAEEVNNRSESPHDGREENRQSWAILAMTTVEVRAMVTVRYGLLRMHPALNRVQQANEPLQHADSFAGTISRTGSVVNWTPGWTPKDASLYLALMNAAKKWHTIQCWPQLVILCGRSPTSTEAHGAAARIAVSERVRGRRANGRACQRGFKLQTGFDTLKKGSLLHLAEFGSGSV